MQTHSPTAPMILGHVGPAGDHNVHPLTAVPLLLEVLSAATGRASDPIGEGFTVRDVSSAELLAEARPTLQAYADAVSAQLSASYRLLSVNGRCAASLASVPRVLAAHPQVVLVWLDAHADLNVPGGSPTDYLGGMAVSGCLGWWDSGLGAGLETRSLVLVGTRAIDHPERELIAHHDITVLPPAAATPEALVAAVAGRPVLFHLDCDALEPGIAATDYREPGGLTLQQLAALAQSLAATSPVVGVEIAEWEGPGHSGATELLDALAPLLGADG